MKKIMTALLSAFMVAGICLTGAACETQRQSGNEEVKIDPTRTQLYVSNFDGGYGSEWLDKLSKRFEDAYADVSFEDGKTGVQIVPDNAKVSGPQLADQVLGSRNEVFFSEFVYYYDYVNRGLVADISDIVKEESLEEFGEEGYIWDKLNEQQKSYYETTDGKIYGLPHYAAFSGIVYDVDLFEREHLYFVAEEGNSDPLNTDYENGNDGFMITGSEKKSNGPDGKTGIVAGVDYSADDGLPATYEEFFMLCDYMLESGITPLIWTGQHQKGYQNWQLQALAADYEGKEQMMLNYTFDGDAKNVIESIDSDGTVHKKEPFLIENENGDELYASAGRYYALKFMEQMLSNTSYYDDKCYNDTQSHLLAQDDFLYSYPESGSATGAIGMMLEGTWWENEADLTFKDVAALYGEEYSRYNRRLGIMPYPAATADEVGKKPTVLDSHYSLIFINANIDEDKLELAKAFVKFAYTDESLVEFTTTTNSPKSVNYTLTDEELSGMSYFGRNVWNFMKTADIVYPYSTNPMYLSNQSAFTFSDTFVSKIGNTTYDNAGSILRANISGHRTAEEFFWGIKEENSDWDLNYSNFF